MKILNFGNLTATLAIASGLACLPPKDRPDAGGRRREAQAPGQAEPTDDRALGADERGDGTDSDGSGVGNTAQPGARHEAPPAADCGGSRKVWAFYFGWYAPQAHGGWKGVEVSHGDSPEYGDGGYDSADAEKIRLDIQVAKAMGIDGFLVAWIGHHPSDPGKDKPNRVWQAMFQQARTAGFCVGVLFETEIILREYRLDVTTQMDYLLRTMKSHDGNVVKIDGQPAVFIWKNELVAQSNWSAIQSSHPVYLVGDAGPKAEGVRAAQAGAYRNAYYYSTWWPSIETAKSTMMRALPGRKRILTVSPGFRDPFGSGVYGRWAGSGPSVYSQQWAFAINQRADHVVITSYNEWPEGHYIEASRKFGVEYLNLTKRHAARFKASAP